MRIAVLLATYNGERFLKAQLLSIIENIRLLKGDHEVDIIVSDDGSQDETVNIIQQVQHQYMRIFILDISRKGGAVANFAFLLKNIDVYDIVFFSDQDDVWMSDKMNLFVAEFASQKDKSIPMLVHSDLSVVDENLCMIATSMFRYQNLNKKASFRQLVVQNSVTGCVMAINQSLLQLVQHSRIEKSIMHDWYMALIASVFGEIRFIDKPTILYRQHGNNQVGAKLFSLRNLLVQMLNCRSQYCKVRQSILRTQKQAALFLADFRGRLPQREERYLSAYQYQKWKFYIRVKLMVLGYRKHGWLRNMIYLFTY